MTLQFKKQYGTGSSFNLDYVWRNIDPRHFPGIAHELKDSTILLLNAFDVPFETMIPTSRSIRVRVRLGITEHYSIVAYLFTNDERRRLLRSIEIHNRFN